jgi:trans-2,3-dihydro-3-hydroxyanthranilate isomerase
MCHSHSNLDDTNANSSRKFPLSLVFSCSPAASRCVTRRRPKLVRVPIQRLRYHRVALKPTRRNFLQLGVSGLAANLATDRVSALATNPTPPNSSRRFRYLLLDVFTTHRLQGNQLAVFPDARGLSDTEMQDIARETRMQETTFVFPRDAATDREHGIKVRIFTEDQELPFAGHPTLGTAIALRNRLQGGNVDRIFLDLKVGKVPVNFSKRDDGVFGEMTQVDPQFGALHDRAKVAELIGVQPAEIHDEWPMQTVSTGIPFVIVPLKRLITLQSLHPNSEKVRAYLANDKNLIDFYFLTRDTADPMVSIRSRGLFSNGEDAATGSASGCTISWMVRYGVVPPDQVVHNLQGVEMKRLSHIYMRAGKEGDKITNVRVGGHAVEIAQGELFL